METKIDKPKIVTSVDARNYLIQNIELMSLKKNDCFFAIYLNENNEVLSLKTIEKKKAETDIEIVSQILDFDKNLNVNSLVVFHKPAKNKGVLYEIPFANMLIDKSFFACVDILDYQWLLNEKCYHSMFEHKTVDLGKHRFKKKTIIKKTERYTSNTNLQELFDMDVDQLNTIIKLEHSKIDWANMFINWELMDIDHDKYMELSFKSVPPIEFELPLTKIYLVGIFNDYMKAKTRIMGFIYMSNLYDRYLIYLFDPSEYYKMRKKEKAAKEEKSKVPTSKWIHTLENSQIFKPEQKVVCNQFAVLDRPLPEGLKYWGIYLIDEVIKCECGTVLLALNGVYCPGVSGRICVCGRDHFPPNAFCSSRFDLVRLNVVR